MVSTIYGYRLPAPPPLPVLTVAVSCDVAHVPSAVAAGDEVDEVDEVPEADDESLSGDELAVVDGLPSPEVAVESADSLDPQPTRAQPIAKVVTIAANARKPLPE